MRKFTCLSCLCEFIAPTDRNLLGLKVTVVMSSSSMNYSFEPVHFSELAESAHQIGLKHFMAQVSTVTQSNSLPDVSNRHSISKWANIRSLWSYDAGFAGSFSASVNPTVHWTENSLSGISDMLRTVYEGFITGKTYVSEVFCWKA